MASQRDKRQEKREKEKSAAEYYRLNTKAVDELLPRMLPHTLVICLSLNENLELSTMLTGLAQAGMEVRWNCAAPQDFPGHITREARHSAKHPTPIPPGLLAPLRLQKCEM